MRLGRQQNATRKKCSLRDQEAEKPSVIEEQDLFFGRNLRAREIVAIQVARIVCFVSKREMRHENNNCFPLAQRLKRRVVSKNKFGASHRIEELV